MKNVLSVLAFGIVLGTGVLVWWFVFDISSSMDHSIRMFFPVVLLVLPLSGLFIRGVLLSETLASWRDGHPNVSVWHVVRDMFHLNYISLGIAGVLLIIVACAGFFRVGYGMAVTDLFGSTKVW